MISPENYSETGQLAVQQILCLSVDKLGDLYCWT